MNEKLGLKNYIGYAITDLGNNIGFSATGAYLILFYSDVLGGHFDAATAKIWGTVTTILIVIARIWDGINDPIMGYFAQRSKPRAAGKFRPFLLYGGLPLAAVIALMFLPLEGMTLVWCTVFAFCTYIAYGMLYTVVLVPYGSLATVMTRRENERSLLSIARSIGGGIGGIPAGILFPVLVYTTTAQGDTYLDGKKLFIAMCAIAVIVVISYVVGYATTEEKFPYPAVAEKTRLRDTLTALLRNKPFVIMSLCGMLLIASSMYIASVDIYLFNVYFNRSGFMSYVTVATYAPMVALIPFAGVIIKKLGKKRMCVYGLILSTVAAFIMMVWRMDNPWIFLVFTFFEGCGIGFFTLEIWAMAMDVIDYQELLTGRREEAQCYAIFTFMRKIGQAMAAAVPALLAGVGYVSVRGYVGQEAGVADGIYTVATVVPFVLFAAMLVLMLLYPLTKLRDTEMRAQLAEMRAQRDTISDQA